MPKAWLNDTEYPDIQGAANALRARGGRAVLRLEPGENYMVGGHDLHFDGLSKFVIDGNWAQVIMAPSSIDGANWRPPLGFTNAYNFSIRNLMANGNRGGQMNPGEWNPCISLGVQQLTPGTGTRFGPVQHVWLENLNLMSPCGDHIYLGDDGQGVGRIWMRDILLQDPYPGGAGFLARMGIGLISAWQVYGCGIHFEGSAQMPVSTQACIDLEPDIAAQGVRQIHFKNLSWSGPSWTTFLAYSGHPGIVQASINIETPAWRG